MSAGQAPRSAWPEARQEHAETGELRNLGGLTGWRTNCILWQISRGVEQDAHYGKSGMTSRQRVLTAVSRREPDRVPFELPLTPFLEERLKAERGVHNPDDYFGVDIRFAKYHAVPEEIDHSRYTAHFPSDAKVDDWGVGVRPVGYFHFGQRIHPMAGLTSVGELADYLFPAHTPMLQDIRRGVQEIQSRGLAAVSSYESGTFEQANALMGMENVLINMHANAEMMRLFFERISDIKAHIAAAYVEAGVDVLWIGDDIGCQRGPILSPAMWREFLIPPLEKIIARARSVRPDIPVAYHSDGYIGFAADGLREAGVNILQAVQPEANDPAELKARYGDRLAFWGGVGSQSTMSRGTPADVKAEVKRLMETVGKGGGYICSPAHRLEPECPLENIYALAEAIEHYGYYR